MATYWKVAVFKIRLILAWVLSTYTAIQFCLLLFIICQGLHNSGLSFPRQHLDAAVDDFIADIQPHDDSALNNSHQNLYGQSNYQWSQNTANNPFPMPSQFTNNFSSSSHIAASRRGGSCGGGGGRARAKNGGRPRNTSNQNRSLVPYTVSEKHERTLLKG